MTTAEFLWKKNEIIRKATGKILIPEDQIVDEPKVKLSDEYFDYRNLMWSACPYCVRRSTIDESGEESRVQIDCSTCPMKKADNCCFDENSTWNKIVTSYEWKNVGIGTLMDLRSLIRDYNLGLRVS
jgi:hypothetical protein